MASTTTATDILSKAGLEEFVEAFRAQGIETTYDLVVLSAENMNKLGLDIDQRKSLKDALRKTGHMAGYDHDHDHDDDSSYYGLPSSEEKDQYMEVFDAIDTDNSGDIDFDEFVIALKKMDQFESLMRTRQLFDQADEDRGGTLDRAEFLKLMHSAKNGGKAAELARMAENGKDAVSKLKESTGLSISIDDIVSAPVTEALFSEVVALKNTHTWVCDFRECNDNKGCNSLLNFLLFNLELLKKMLELTCISLLEDFEKKLLELNLLSSGGALIGNLNVEAVIQHSLLIFISTCHKFSHTKADEIKMETMVAKSDDFTIKYLHSFRRAAVLDAANESVDEVREHVIKILRQQHEQQPGAIETVLTSIGKDVATDLAVEALFETVVLPTAMTVGCSIM